MTSRVEDRNCWRLISRKLLRAATAALGFAVVLIAGAIAIPSAQAQSFRALYSFKGGTDGAGAYGGLIRDAAGNLYGTTSGNAPGASGTVFMLDRMTRKEMPLYDFTGGTDGGFPQAGLLMGASGNLYGTTVFGGDLSCGGCGTVFRVDPTTGKETVLYAFTGGADGSEPICTLVRDRAGDLYGTTAGGGSSASCANPSGCGTVFKLDTTGKETVLYSFCGGADGGYPQAGLIRDAAGNLYGTALVGAYLAGVVFMVDPSGAETVLYSFTGGTDGGYPLAALIRDSAGNLYGTTNGGGASNQGTVFKVDPTGKETVLYSFTGGTDGANPGAGLVRDSAGNLYGTAGGGASNQGTVFKLDTTGAESVLYSFTGGTDGGNPAAGLLPGPDGRLYGTTLYGGDLSCGFGIGCGVVFGIKP
jgi:uncharacterized repeat protein (TIGR03803 family)